MVAYNYGRISSMAVDPIEKKPFFHYHPGSRVFSVGGIGCNLRCRYCQNYTISMSPIGKKRTTFKSPEELVALCRQQRFDSIAFTYNEPAIWFEYIMDVANCDPDLDIVMVTNGMINESPLKELCGKVDAMNIDVKAFDERFYREICGGSLDDVKRSCEVVNDRDTHLELTYLVVPGHNDGEDEIRSFAKWVADDLSPDVPVHFTRFHPDYQMTTVPLTPVETLVRAKDIALDEGLHYPYLGNVLVDGASDTVCPECGAVAVRRTGYLVDTSGLDGDSCSACGHRLNMIVRSQKQEHRVPDRQGEERRGGHRHHEGHHRGDEDVLRARLPEPPVDVWHILILGCRCLHYLPVPDVLGGPYERLLRLLDGHAVALEGESLPGCAPPRREERPADRQREQAGCEEYADGRTEHSASGPGPVHQDVPGVRREGDAQGHQALGVGAASQKPRGVHRVVQEAEHRNGGTPRHHLAAVAVDQRKGREEEGEHHECQILLRIPPQERREGARTPQSVRDVLPPESPFGDAGGEVRDDAGSAHDGPVGVGDLPCAPVAERRRGHHRHDKDGYGDTCGALDVHDRQSQNTFIKQDW